jgi:hypothetical protein
MNVLDIFNRFLRPDVPPPPPPTSGVPTDEEIRWAKMQTDKIIQRAEELGIEVQLEEASR